MVCEMAGSYSLLVPLMLVCGLHVLLSRQWTLYEEQVASPIDSPAHQGDFLTIPEFGVGRFIGGIRSGRRTPVGSEASRRGSGAR